MYFLVLLLAFYVQSGLSFPNQRAIDSPKSTIARRFFHRSCHTLDAIYLHPLEFSVESPPNQPLRALEGLRRIIYLDIRAIAARTARALEPNNPDPYGRHKFRDYFGPSQFHLIRNAHHLFQLIAQQSPLSDAHHTMISCSERHLRPQIRKCHQRNHGLLPGPSLWILPGRLADLEGPPGIHHPDEVILCPTFYLLSFARGGVSQDSQLASLFYASVVLMMIRAYGLTAYSLFHGMINEPPDGDGEPPYERADIYTALAMAIHQNETVRRAWSWVGSEPRITFPDGTEWMDE